MDNPSLDEAIALADITGQLGNYVVIPRIALTALIAHARAQAGDALDVALYRGACVAALSLLREDMECCARQTLAGALGIDSETGPEVRDG